MNRKSNCSEHTIHLHCNYSPMMFFEMFCEKLCLCCPYHISITDLQQILTFYLVTPSRAIPFRKRRKRTSKNDLTSALSDDILHKIFSYIPTQSWFNIIMTCKRFHLLGTEVFDPSYYDNEPIRVSCMMGNILAVCFMRLKHILIYKGP
jgi:hypothetical protein